MPMDVIKETLKPTTILVSLTGHLLSCISNLLFPRAIPYPLGMPKHLESTSQICEKLLHVSHCVSGKSQCLTTYTLLLYDNCIFICSLTSTAWIKPHLAYNSHLCSLVEVVLYGNYLLPELHLLLRATCPVQSRYREMAAEACSKILKVCIVPHFTGLSWAPNSFSTIYVYLEYHCNCWILWYKW